MTLNLDEMDGSEATVKKHMYVIFKKLQVSNRVELLNKIKDLDFSV
ncbi:MAG: LuxR C-terminal-related transcriptional regulator [Spirochaetes bacterium]|nr:LuxR C-terminal-related transcriptional regulator [Spirochaetota bacterium]